MGLSYIYPFGIVVIFPCTRPIHYKHEKHRFGFWCSFLFLKFHENPPKAVLSYSANKQTNKQTNKQGWKHCLRQNFGRVIKSTSWWNCGLLLLLAILDPRIEASKTDLLHLPRSSVLLRYVLLILLIGINNRPAHMATHSTTNSTAFMFATNRLHANIS